MPCGALLSGASGPSRGFCVFPEHPCPAMSRGPCVGHQGLSPHWPACACAPGGLVAAFKAPGRGRVRQVGRHTGAICHPCAGGSVAGTPAGRQHPHPYPRSCAHTAPAQCRPATCPFPLLSSHACTLRLRRAEPAHPLTPPHTRVHCACAAQSFKSEINMVTARKVITSMANISCDT